MPRPARCFGGEQKTMLRYQLKNIIFTPATAIAVIGLYLFMIVSIYPEPYNDIVYNYQYATQLGYGSFFVPVAVVLPISFFLHHSGQQKDMQFSLIRSKLPSYTGSTVISAILSGMFVALAAFILFTVSCLLIKSAEGSIYFGTGFLNDRDTPEFYQGFLSKPILLYFMMGAIYTVNGAIWPVISLLAFSFMKNQYLVVAIPFILKLVMSFIGQMSEIFLLDPSQLELFGGVSYTLPGGGIPYLLCYIGIVILTCGGIWSFRTFREVRHA